MSGFHPLAERQFKLFFVAHGLSAFGTAMVPIALSFALVSSGGTAIAVGSVLACEAIPLVILTPVAGVFGDRWPRRIIIIYSDILRCLTQLALFTLFALSQVDLYLILPLSLLIGVGNAFSGPAAGGLLPQLVVAEQLQKANGLLAMANCTALIIAPAFAGIIVGIWGPKWALAVDAVTYGASAACIAMIRLKFNPVASTAASAFCSDFWLGLREVLQRPWLLVLIIQFAILNFLVVPPVLVLGPSTYATTAEGAASWGLVVSACGVGGIIGGLIGLYFKPSNPLIVIELAILSFVVPLILLSFQVAVEVMLIGGALIGVAVAIVHTLLGTVIQLEIPAGSLSRVYSILGLVAAGVAPVGYGLVGPVAAQISPRYLLWVAIAVVVSSVFAALATKSVWKFRTTAA